MREKSFGGYLASELTYMIKMNFQDIKCALQHILFSNCNFFQSTRVGYLLFFYNSITQMVSTLNSTFFDMFILNPFSGKGGPCLV